KAEKDGTFRRTGALNNPPAALLGALTRLESKHALEGSDIPRYLEDLKVKWPRLVPKYLRAESLEDVLFRSNYHHVDKKHVDDSDVEDWEDEEDQEERCAHCDRSKVVKRKPVTREMCIHYGLIASGNQVV